MHNVNIERYKSGLSPLQIVLIYFFVGAFWIFTSDKLLAVFVHNENTRLYLETFKGWFYERETCQKHI